MAKADLFNVLYSKEKDPLDFKFDSLWLPSMYNYVSQYDIEHLYNIASSIRYSANIEKKYAAIDNIMRNRGFRKFHCGTNRIVYKFLEDQSFVAKIALDKVGLTDNPAEYKNQFLLKPFVTKVFETTPCGTLATVERVEPITCREQFNAIGEDVFELLNNFIIGKYVLEDIGSHYFMNYGLRKGFGAVLLDYTYVYLIDGKKLHCNKRDLLTGQICDGLIDYDDGFNNLICTKCGKKYLAKHLVQDIKNELIYEKNEGDVDMKITIKRGNDVILQSNTQDETDYIQRKSKRAYDNSEENIFKVTILGKPQNPISEVAKIVETKEESKQEIKKSSNSRTKKQSKEETISDTERFEKYKKDKEKNNDKEDANYKQMKFNMESTFVSPKKKDDTKEVKNAKKDDVKKDKKSKKDDKEIEEGLGLTSEKVKKETESNIKETKNKDDVISKYEKMYGDHEEESFEKMNKKSNKFDNY